MKYIQVPEAWIRGLIKARQDLDSELDGTLFHKAALIRLKGYLDTCEILLDEDK